MLFIRTCSIKKLQLACRPFFQQHRLSFLKGEYKNILYRIMISIQAYFTRYSLKINSFS